MTTTLDAARTGLVTALNRQQANTLVAYLNYRKVSLADFRPAVLRYSPVV